MDPGVATDSAAASAAASPYHTRRSNRMTHITQMLQDSEASGSEDELESASEEDDSSHEVGPSTSNPRASNVGALRSQYRGVSYDKKKRKWRVQIKVRAWLGMQLGCTA